MGLIWCFADCAAGAEGGSGGKPPARGFFNVDEQGGKHHAYPDAPIGQYELIGSPTSFGHGEDIGRDGNEGEPAADTNNQTEKRP